MFVKIFRYIFLLLFLCGRSLQHSVLKRSIDLIAAHGLIVDSRLPREIAPTSYTIDLHPFPEEGYFKGKVKINLTWNEPMDKITLHVDQDLIIDHSELKVIQYVPDDEKLRSLTAPHQPVEIKVKRSEAIPKKPLYVIHLEKQLKTGTQCVVELEYSGKLYNDTSEGLFRSQYINALTGEKQWFVASQLRPNFARKVFPCFDEPAFKANFLVSIVRCNKMKSLSNMPLYKSEELRPNSKWVRDYFEESPPMSTFTFGVLVSDFVSVSVNETNEGDSGPKINIWATPDFINAVQNTTEKVYTSVRALEKLWDFQFPLPKLDCVALPNYQGTRPADNWGLIFFKESELSGKGSWLITHELVYQWLGDLATPFWWSDAHVNNALARYVTSYITLQVSDGKETCHNWPMTMLYSIYYEFSKRYPHGKVMAIKQDSSSTKTELVFRMLNYTVGEKTFNSGLQRFIADRQYRTFFGDDVWSAITEQARIDGTFDKSITANEIAGSWISKDRLPVLNVIRSSDGTTATITQRVYLRERPHDVPEQEKYLWWIPIVLVTQDKLNFSNSFPVKWMKMEREVSLADLPKEDKFIIINPEEIGPFPVNYDATNWNLLAQFLQSDERNKIPVNTRAKLLHDAWNLAYAGDLSFSTALDMTLFLKYEREYLAWDPVFTMIDHIGRHIDGSSVHKKFLMYVRMLLTPLYEELGTEAQEGEIDDGKANLRSSSKVFLCQAGYKPCIEEAQHAFDKWMTAENPDEGNPVANQYICPVFKWGTKEEWEFGLQRIINFPPARKQSERTYLLKTLAGCPIDSWKIEKILNITILEQNGNFTDNDIYLVFSMLTGSSSGYTTLFNYLTKNWNALKKAFETKPQLWNSLITSSTSVFKTQEGLDMVTKLYKDRQHDFGTADFVITKAIKNIKEEAKWSNDNLPVIENWLQKFLNVEKNVTASEVDKFL